MSNKVKKILEKKISLLDNFLDGVKNANEVVPVVQKAKETSEWLLQSVNSTPKPASSIFEDPEIEEVQSIDLNIWDKGLPKITINPEFITTSGSAASGTASEVVFTKLVDFRKNPEYPRVASLIEPLIENYMQLQAKHNKPNEIIESFKKISTKLAREFEQANQSYMKANSGVLQTNEAAIGMRNVLEHFVGELLELARKVENRQVKNKEQQWLFISEKLATGGVGSSEYKLLKQKYKNHKEIHKELTGISKSLVNSSLLKLRVTHTKWVDHLFTSLKLIDLKKIRKNQLEANERRY